MDWFTSPDALPPALRWKVSLHRLMRSAWSRTDRPVIPPTDTPIHPSRLDQHREWLRGDEPFRHLGRGITHTPNELIEDPASSVPESARAILKVLITTFNAWMHRSGSWMSRSTAVRKPIRSRAD